MFDEVTAQTAELDDEIKLSTDLLEEAKTFHANKIAGDVQDFKFQLISHSDVICATLDACNSKDLQEIFVEYEYFNSMQKVFKLYLTVLESLMKEKTGSLEQCCKTLLMLHYRRRFFMHRTRNFDSIGFRNE